jgi:hypothetical protein
LTHIALSGTIKFWSQMVDILVRICDSEHVIAGLALHFFHELQTKAPNTAFNFLPEYIQTICGRRKLKLPDKNKSTICFLIEDVEKQ